MAKSIIFLGLIISLVLIPLTLKALTVKEFVIHLQDKAQVVTRVVDFNNVNFEVKVFKLYPNFPNPFNAQTLIRFQLPTKTLVSLTVYNLLGQEVITLLEGKYAEGTVRVEWDGKDAAGSTASAGVYFLRLTTEQGEVKTTRVMLIK